MNFSKIIQSFNSHNLFFREFLLTNYGNLLIPNERKEIRNPFVRYIKCPLSDIKWYLKRNFIIKNNRRLEIRNLILKYCSKPNKNIRFVINYALDISYIDDSKNNVAFCFGIYNDISFEEKLAENFGFETHCFDPTPVAVKYMKDIDNNFNLKFHPQALWTEDCTKKFYFRKSNQTKNDMEGSLIKDFAETDDYLEVECYTLDSFKKKIGIDKVDLLKMDIEGAGFEVLDKLNKESPDSLPSQITAEIEIPPDGGEKTESGRNIFKLFINRLHDFFDSISQNYTIYYVPRGNRYNNLEILMVKNTLINKK